MAAHYVVVDDVTHHGRTTPLGTLVPACIIERRAQCEWLARPLSASQPTSPRSRSLRRAQPTRRSGRRGACPHTASDIDTRASGNRPRHARRRDPQRTMGGALSEVVVTVAVAWAVGMVVVAVAFVLISLL